MAKSALRVLQILEYIAQYSDGCTHTQLAQGMDIPKSSVTALLADMQSLGYLTRHPDTNKYCVGVQVLSLANAYLRSLNLARLGSPILSRLYGVVKHFSVLCIAVETDYAVIATESQPAIYTHSLQIGYRAPLYCSAVGKAILSHLPEAEVNRILLASSLDKLTPSTKTSPKEIKQELTDVRKAGIAYSRGENIAGITGLAAPVFDHAGHPVAAIGVASPTHQLKPEDFELIEAELLKSARELSDQLGWRPRR
jgi:DNA-binding IclR family transcriptional regulator